MDELINKSNDENIIVIQDPKTLEDKTYYKLITFDSDDGKSYIVYSDGSIDENGALIVKASIYDPTGIDLRLLPIETEEEWRVIEKVYKSIETDIVNARKGENNNE